jgi:hypothetical protein
VTARKVYILVTIGMLIFSLTVSARPINAAIHVQTFGYEGRDVLNLNMNITGEDSDYISILSTLECSSFSFVIFLYTYCIACITLISSLMRYTKRR